MLACVLSAVYAAQNPCPLAHLGDFGGFRATDHATGRGILDGPKEALEPVRLARLVSPRIADYGSELIS
jgi:hypothetical protein